MSKADEFRHEEHTRKRKGGAEASVENRDVFKRDPAGIAQGDSPGHHEDHNTVGFQVKKTQNTVFFILHSVDPADMFLEHFKKHGAEQAKNNGTENDVEDRDVIRVNYKPNSSHISSCGKPDDAGN